MPTAAARPDVSVCRWGEIAGVDRLLPAIDEVFFESALTKTFKSESVRRAFRERWLGRYLEHDPAFAYVALAGEGETVAGYLVGARDNPAITPRFSDIAVRQFATHTGQYPAHLHINLAPAYRNRGIGGRLIDAFIADLQRDKAPGVHVITGFNARNVEFYRRHGFLPLDRARLAGSDILLLGRLIPGQETA